MLHVWNGEEVGLIEIGANYIIVLIVEMCVNTAMDFILLSVELWVLICFQIYMKYKIIRKINARPTCLVSFMC